MTDQYTDAYLRSRDALREQLRQGTVDAKALREMQKAMRALAPNRIAFGADRYDDLRDLLTLVEQLPRYRSQPIPARRPYHRVPFPYQLAKLDLAWMFVIFLVGAGCFLEATGNPLGVLFWLVAGFIAFMRALVWCSFRFPMTTFFFVGVIRGLLGGRRW